MPAPAFVNLGSGMDTGKVIQQLMDIERIPVQRIKQDNDRNRLMIKGWEEVRNRTFKLQESSRELYSFAGPFATREVISGDEGAITGEASANAKDVEQNIQVVRMAGHHQINSDPVSDDLELPAGTFKIRIHDTVSEIRFPGGNIRKLFQVLQKEKGESFDVFTVRTDGEHSLLGIRSMVSGERGEIRIEDESGLFKKIGMIGPVPPEDEKSFPIPFQATQISTYKGDALKGLNLQDKGKWQILEGGNGLHLEAGTSVSLNHELSADSTLEWSWEKTGRDPDKSPDPSEKPSKPSGTEPGESMGNDVRYESISTGPDVRLQVGDVELSGYGAERSRPIKNKDGESDADSTGSENGGSGKPEQGSERAGESGLVFSWEQDGKEAWKLVNEKEFQPGTDGRYRLPLQEITGGPAVKSIAFYTTNRADLKIKELKEIRGGENGSLEGPLHVTDKAEDALLKINGIEIKRPDNTGLTDVIPGVKLDLHRTMKAAAPVTVKVNAEKVTNRIKEWVESYNDLMKFLRENSYSADAGEFKANRPDQGEKDISGGLNALRDSQGVFASDSTVRRLVSDLREIVGSAYFAPDRDGFKVLNDIGIHTGGPGQNWEEIKFGYLQIDEPKLLTSLSRSPENVKNLFASDRNTDSVVDSGAAFRMNTELAPYTRRAGGMITARIDSLKTKIDDNNKQADKIELSIKGKEERLRQKFGKMEQSIRESKDVGNYLKNNMKTQ